MELHSEHATLKPTPGTGDAVQLGECSSRRRKAPGSNLSTTPNLNHPGFVSTPVQSTGGLEAGKSEVHSHPQIHGELEDSLSIMRQNTKINHFLKNY